MASLPTLELQNVFIAIHLVLARRLMVTHFDMDLNPTVPIAVLKQELVNQLGMPVSQQQWFYRNTPLDDRHTLERCGVAQDSIVEVRPLPGPSGGPPSAAELYRESFHMEAS